MKHLFLSIIFSFCLFILHGQDEVPKSELFEQMSNSDLFVGLPFYGNNEAKNNVEKIEDSAYLIDEWTQGILQDKAENFFRVNVKYNVLNNTMDINVNDEIRSLYPTKINYIYFDKQLFIPKFQVTGLKKDSLSYVQLLVDGTIQIFAEYRVNKYQTSNNPMSNVSKNINISNNIFYKIETELFYSKNDNFQVFKKGKKQIISLVTEKEKRIKKFVKDNELFYRKEEDAKKIIIEYNRLMKKNS